MFYNHPFCSIFLSLSFFFNFCFSLSGAWRGFSYIRAICLSSDEGISNSNFSTEILTVYLVFLNPTSLTVHGSLIVYHWSMSAFPTDYSLSLPYPSMKKFLFMPGPHIGKQAKLSYLLPQHKIFFKDRN